MPHRHHLFSLRVGHALRESRITPHSLTRDAIAGVTVGIIAIPLAMALAIASGVAPQYGLYTAAIAGLVIALTGGSRYSISGPTAAFVVILYPVTQQFGLGGLLLATALSGVLLIAMAFLRLGRFIEYIPEPVTLGFTGGIAVVIAVLQLKDALGLPLDAMPTHFPEKVQVILAHLGEMHWPSVTVALITLAVMLLWPRLRLPVPAHLPAVILATLVAWLFNSQGWTVDTIQSRFTWTDPEGLVQQGIPNVLPALIWPWQAPGPDGQSLSLDWTLLTALLPAAFAMAMLGAIESLLCAVVLDGMTETRHSANSELLGQGIGNVVAPFFGGITATAAIARSAANVRAGAQTPLAAAIHALVVLLAILLLAPILAYLPMSGMAALLLVVAWNMSEAPKIRHLLKTSLANDRWVFVVCFALTVLFDMVIAITTGILLAAVLFMKEMAEMTLLQELDQLHPALGGQSVPAGWRVYRVTGPLFFAAADKVFSDLTRQCQANSRIILYLEGVRLLDAGGIAALNKLIGHCRKVGAQLVLTDVQFQPLKSMARARMQPIDGVFRLYSRLPQAIEAASAG